MWRQTEEGQHPDKHLQGFGSSFNLLGFQEEEDISVEQMRSPLEQNKRSAHSLPPHFPPVLEKAFLLNRPACSPAFFICLILSDPGVMSFLLFSLLPWPHWCACFLAGGWPSWPRSLFPAHDLSLPSQPSFSTGRAPHPVKVAVDLQGTRS